MKTNTRLLRGAAALGLVAAFGAAMYQAGAQAAAVPQEGRSVVDVLDNHAFNIRRITYQPGYQQQMHVVAAGRDEVIVQITPGRMTANIDGAVEVGEAGKVWWTPKAPSLHAFGNADTHPISFLVVQRKE